MTATCVFQQPHPPPPHARTLKHAHLTDNASLHIQGRVTIGYLASQPCQAHNETKGHTELRTYTYTSLLRRPTHRCSKDKRLVKVMSLVDVCVMDQMSTTNYEETARAVRRRIRGKWRNRPQAVRNMRSSSSQTLRQPGVFNRLSVPVRTQTEARRCQRRDEDVAHLRGAACCAFKTGLHSGFNAFAVHLQ
ncbi:hypothetical protein PAMA_011461 [Pampus argenteus]